MDKNTITGLILIALLFMVFNMFVAPPPPPPQQTADSTAVNNPNMRQDSLNLGDPMLPSPNNNNTTASQSGLFLQPTAPSESFYELANDKLKVTISNKGGRIYKSEIKDYVTHSKEPLILMDGPNNQFNYKFFLNNYLVSTDNFYFEPHQTDANNVILRLYADSSKTRYLEQKYTLRSGSYIVDYDLNMVGFDDLINNQALIELHWKNDLRPQEKDIETEQYVTGVYYKEKGDDVNYLSESSDDEKQVSLSLTWVAFKQQFFNHTLIADKAFTRGNLKIKAPPKDKNNTTLLETASADLAFEYQRSPQFNFPMHFYIGPNNYKLLKNLDLKAEGQALAMEEMVPLGWTIFGWVNRWIIIPSFNFLHRFIGNYGVIILVLTLIIKLVLFPLTYRSYKSFAKMNVLKPEIEELKKKYGKDPQKLQSEQMKLYSKAGVNPLGGCLPQLLQMPILFAMYRFFPASIELRQQSFLWAEDLSTYDSIMDLPFNIPFYGDHVSLFCLLSAASSLIYMRLNQQMTPSNDAMGGQMKIFQYTMPAMLLFFFNSFSAGLTYYFFLSNIISFVQQYAIKKYFIDEEKLLKQIQENKKKPVKKSKWQQRLEDMAKAQQQAQQQQKQQKKGHTRRRFEQQQNNSKNKKNRKRT